MNPRCIGAVSTCEGKTYLDVRIDAWWVLVSPGILLLLFLFVAIVQRSWALMAGPALVLWLATNMHWSFWQEVRELEELFMKFADPSVKPSPKN